MIESRRNQTPYNRFKFLETIEETIKAKNKYSVIVYSEEHRKVQPQKKSIHKFSIQTRHKPMPMHIFKKKF